MRFILLPILGLAVLGSVFFLYPQTFVEAPHRTVLPKIFYTGEKTEEVKPITITFVGDIMLARGVEVHMDREGAGYPFMYVPDFLKSPDIMVGNFEAVVTKEHISTPSMTFQFSVREEYFTALTETGFDVLSLGNNHSLDYGEDELIYTKGLCMLSGVLCGGYPNRIGDDSFVTKEIGDETIGFLLLSTVWGELHRDDVARLIEKSVASSTFQVAYVHWGDEYELVHNERQERLAHVLIDGGIDVVVGHHPHVVQDIEIYNGKPIFYSLGNFIFDQYFSRDVQEGLGIELTLTASEAEYMLTSFRNDRGRSQPHKGDEKNHRILLERILAPHASTSEVSLEEGVLRIPRK